MSNSNQINQFFPELPTLPNLGTVKSSELEVNSIEELFTRLNELLSNTTVAEIRDWLIEIRDYYNEHCPFADKETSNVCFFFIMPVLKALELYELQISLNTKN